jgi:hypothetical protein
MRLYERKQSNTSPLKYHLEFSPEELERVTDLVAQIIRIIQQEEKDKHERFIKEDHSRL